MLMHQAVNLHLPMIFGAARDLRKRRRRGGLGQLDFGLNFGQSLARSQQDDWWQRYVYDTTQGALRVLGARYGEGEYYPVDDPRFRPQPQPPNIDLTVRPTAPPLSEQKEKEEGIRLTTNQIVLGIAFAFVFLQGKRGR